MDLLNVLSPALDAVLRMPERFLDFEIWSCKKHNARKVCNITTHSKTVIAQIITEPSASQSNPILITCVKQITRCCCFALFRIESIYVAYQIDFCLCNLSNTPPRKFDYERFSRKLTTAQIRARNGVTATFLEYVAPEMVMLTVNSLQRSKTWLTTERHHIKYIKSH